MPLKAERVDFEKLAGILRFVSDGTIVNVKVNNRSMSFCLEGRRIFFETDIEGVKRFLSETAMDGNRAIVEMVEGKCRSGFSMDVEEFVDLLLKAEKLKGFPSRFRLKVLRLPDTPPAIGRFDGMIIGVGDLYRIGYTPLDLIGWMDRGFTEVRKASFLDVLSPLFGGFSVALAVFLMFLSLLPFDPSTITKEKLFESFNPLISKKVAGKKLEGFIGKRDCYLNRIYAGSPGVVSPGPDRRLRTDDDIALKFPVKGYRPFFCLP